MNRRKMMGPAVAASAGMSSSRQKNCDSCVQAKRRCDRQTPCSRCVEKKITCVLSKSKTTARLGKRAREPTPCTEVLSQESPTYSPLNVCDLSFDLDNFETISTGFHPSGAPEPAIQTTHDTGDSFLDTFMHFPASIGPSSSDRWFTRTEESYLPDRPATPADGKVVRAWDKMAMCQLEAWHIYDPRTSLYYVLHRVKEFTVEMATKNSTPFLHRGLYHMYTPQSIVSCFTTCVLYANRTPTNTPIVMRAFSDSARDLVDAEACRVVSTPIEKLARSQALFLYQIIRLFDGDVTLRAQGERDMALFKTWLDDLCHIRNNLGDLAQLEYAAVREQPSIEWEKWIFGECVRRTIFIAHTVISLFELLRDPEHKPDLDNPWAYVHRWTLGRSLWNASSPAEFQIAWKETPHFVVSNFFFEDFIENGRGEDVDEFAEILLNAYMGVDALKEFMTTPNNNARDASPTKPP
ncbi:hypothetical protein F5Y14DRAFT_257652 [Nemania sp. NC0429]|nr:hypothetical protein F5Y14DRAFT_257652 [Nemania sp. NC0429]